MATMYIHDVIIAHVISADAQIYMYRYKQTQKTQSNLRNSFVRGQLVKMCIAI